MRLDLQHIPRDLEVRVEGSGVYPTRNGVAPQTGPKHSREH